MKLDKNFFIPLFITLFVCAISVIFTKIPLSLVLGIIIFLVIPILLLQNKTNNDWGLMFIFGIPSALLFVLLLVGAFTLTNKFPWLKDILFWPYK